MPAFWYLYPFIKILFNATKAVLTISILLLVAIGKSIVLAFEYYTPLFWKGLVLTETVIDFAIKDSDLIFSEAFKQ